VLSLEVLGRCDTPLDHSREVLQRLFQLHSRNRKFRTCPVQTFGRARTNLGRATGRDQTQQLFAVDHAREVLQRLFQLHQSVRAFLLSLLIKSVGAFLLSLLIKSNEPRRAPRASLGGLIKTP